MRNYFHLVVETPNANLVAGMRWLLSAYTLRFNPRHKRFGHVLSGRYKAVLVEGERDGISAHGLRLRASEPGAGQIVGAGTAVVGVPMEELRRIAWTEEDLDRRAKNDPVKLALAARVRRETTVTLRWLAVRLHLGSWKSFNANLYRWRRAQAKVQP